MHSLQGRRHIARDDAISKALDDGRLAHAGLAGEDGIVLAAAHEDVDHLAHFLVAPQHRIDLAGLGIGGEVDRVLIEELRFAAGRPGGGLASGGRLLPVSDRGAQAGLRLGGLGDDFVEVTAQALDGDVLEFLAAIPGDSGEFFVAQKREQGEPGANISSVEVDAGHRPRFGEHLDRGGAERRLPSIPALECVEVALQFPGQSGAVDSKVLENRNQVVVAAVEHFQQVVLDLHVVVCPCGAQGDGVVKCQPRCIIELVNQRLQVCAHSHSRPLTRESFTAPGTSHRRDRARAAGF